MIVFNLPKINKRAVKTLSKANGKKLKNIIYNGTKYPIAELKNDEFVSSLLLTDCADAFYKSIELQGKTYQETFEGYNLLNFNNTERTFTINGNYGYSNFSCLSNCSLSSGNTYTVSFKAKGVGNIIKLVLYESVGNNVFASKDVNLSLTNEYKTYAVTFNITNNLNVASIMLQLFHANDSITFKDVMITLGTYNSSNVKKYEKYVGGMASPNANYPQPISGANGFTLNVNDVSITVPLSVTVNGNTVNIPLYNVGNVCNKIVLDGVNKKVYFIKNIGEISNYDLSIDDTLNESGYISSTGGLTLGANVIYPLNNELCEVIDITSSTFAVSLLSLKTLENDNVLSATGNNVPSKIKLDYFVTI